MTAPKRTLTQRLRGISYRATESLRPSVDSIVVEVERLEQERQKFATLFYNIASHKVEHRNMGQCPDSPTDTERDPLCHVCKGMRYLERSRAK